MDPVVSHVDKVRVACRRRVLHNVGRLRVERRAIRRRVAHVHPLGVVERLPCGSVQHQRVRGPAGQVRRDDVVGAVRMPEERHAFKDRVFGDQAGSVVVIVRQPRDARVSVVARPHKVCSVINRVFEEGHVQRGDAIRLQRMHKHKRSGWCVRLEDANMPEPVSRCV